MEPVMHGLGVWQGGAVERPDGFRDNVWEMRDGPPDNRDMNAMGRRDGFPAGARERRDGLGFPVNAVERPRPVPGLPMEGSDHFPDNSTVSSHQPLVAGQERWPPPSQRHLPGNQWPAARSHPQERPLNPQRASPGFAPPPEWAAEREQGHQRGAARSVSSLPASERSTPARRHPDDPGSTRPPEQVLARKSTFKGIVSKML